jgi:hypothetical protein
MKYKLLFILPVLASFLMAAHFLRKDFLVLTVGLILLPLILFSKRWWVMKFFQFLLFIGGGIWIERTLFLIKLRHPMSGWGSFWDRWHS